MEHLNRKTTQNIDTLLIVSDPTRIGLRTTKRIKELIDKLSFLVIKNKYLVLNRVSEHFKPSEVEQFIKDTGLPLIESIPFNEELGKLELAGKPISSLSSNSPLLTAIQSLITKFH